MSNYMTLNLDQACIEDLVDIINYYNTTYPNSRYTNSLMRTRDAINASHFHAINIDGPAVMTVTEP